MANSTKKTYEQLTLGMFLEPTYGASERRVRTSQLPDNEKAWAEIDHPSLEKYLGLSGKSMKKTDPNGLSTRMLKGCFQVTEEKISSQFSLKWMNWGTMRNGVFSTAKTGEYRRAENECTLSDILEDTVPKKFFLSKEQMERIVFQ